MIKIMISLLTAIGLSACVNQFSTLGTIQTTTIEEVVSQCDAGDLKACLNAGRRYRSGMDAPENIDLAVKYFNLSCSGKNREACEDLYDIGWNLYRTNKYTRDDPSLLEMFKVSCAGDYGPACSSLGYNISQ